MCVRACRLATRSLLSQKPTSWLSLATPIPDLPRLSTSKFLQHSICSRIPLPATVNSNLTSQLMPMCPTFWDNHSLDSTRPCSTTRVTQLESSKHRLLHLQLPLSTWAPSPIPLTLPLQLWVWILATRTTSVASVLEPSIHCSPMLKSPLTPTKTTQLWLQLHVKLVDPLGSMEMRLICWLTMCTLNTYSLIQQLMDGTSRHLPLVCHLHSLEPQAKTRLTEAYVLQIWKHLLC